MMGVGRMAMAKRGARGKSEDDLSCLFGLSCWPDRQTHQAQRGASSSGWSGLSGLSGLFRWSGLWGRGRE